MVQGNLDFSKQKKLTGHKLNCFLTLKYFLDQNINDGFVPNYVFQYVEIGAVSGLRSLRKLNTEFGIKYEPRQIEKDGKKTGTWEYKLIMNSVKNSVMEMSEYWPMMEILNRKFGNKFNQDI